MTQFCNLAERFNAQHNGPGKFWKMWKLTSWKLETLKLQRFLAVGGLAFVTPFLEKLQGVFLTGTPPKNSKYKKVNLG